MKRIAGALLVLAVFGIGYLYGVCAIDRSDGSNVAPEGAALAQEIQYGTDVDMGEIKWYDDFDIKIIEQREWDRDTETYADNARAVPLSWMLAVVLRNIEKEEKDLVFVVTNAEGKVIPADEYHIYIRGYGRSGDLSWAEDFPPILYP
jgi:hypothetical protein